MIKNGVLHTSAKDGGNSKRRKLDEGSAQSSSSQVGVIGEDEAIGRPPGVKAAKATAKRSARKAAGLGNEESEKLLLECKKMWVIKQQDLAMREKLSKNKLLDSLLAKSEPLSDIEITLKNKLITDMLSNG
ncbi:hypothetical protein V5N11_008775 [Cardamine amara subsp. amara]|uniref:No apical meristem-associated C-terminal domain-containing protein n=1 Tax=Cardamine amara subsp. amara TaxID=228776 RepID=A0ABD0ZJ27_CARAN